jgi:hypothetical protein
MRVPKQNAARYPGVTAVRFRPERPPSLESLKERVAAACRRASIGFAYRLRPLLWKAKHGR